MGDLGSYGLFDDDDDERQTVVESLWAEPQIPNYPPLAHFGRFEILGRLARGGMAEVYLAREWDDDGKARHLVVKRVLPEMEQNPSLLSMFLDEGKTATRLFHSHVCHVYECDEIDGVAFMALEWVWGPSLDQVIRRSASRGGCIPWPVAVEMVAQVADALHYVHHASGVGGKPLHIVHQDVSPHNVMLSWSGTAKLLDFGIAKTSQEEGGGGTAGKYGYMSPEQAQSKGGVDARSDVFALGIVLFEALAGRALYDRPTVLDTLSAVVREPPPSIRAERSELPDALESIVQRALAKDPAARFQSAGELKAALRQVLRSHGQTVNAQRIGLFLQGIFPEHERVPLRPEGLNLSGAFGALTEAGAAAVLGEPQVTFQSFAHDEEPAAPPAPTSSPEAEPAPIPEPVDESPRTGSRALLGVLALGLLMGGVGAVAAYLLLT